VSRASGREIDARADEFFAVFERATAAAEAAVAIQRELGNRTWTDDLADFPRRATAPRGASERRGVWGPYRAPHVTRWPRVAGPCRDP